MGKPLSEETKKKISEALTKNGPKKPIGSTSFSGTRSPEADLLYRQYIDASNTINGIRNQQKQLAAQAKSLGRKKASKGQRAALQAKIKALAEKAKAAIKQRQEVVRQATLQRRLKNLKNTETKAALRKNEINRLRSEVQGAAVTSKNKDRTKRMADRLKTLDKMDKRQDEIVATAKSKAVEYQSAYMRGETSSRAFSFSENHSRGFIMLNDVDFRPFRDLTYAEKRVNFARLNDEFNTLENQIRQELQAQVSGAIAGFNQAVDDKINAGEIAAIAALYFLLRGSVKKTLNDAAKKAYEAGKISAVAEFNGVSQPENQNIPPGTTAVLPAGTKKVQVPPTSAQQTQLRSLETDQNAETMISSIENAGKQTIAQGIAAGAATAAIVAAASAEMHKKANKVVESIASSTVATNIARGRTEVFAANGAKIYAYMRTEILDAVTCNVCISIDQKIIAPDDPMRTLDQVHTYCRGEWVPIFHDDPIKPEITGIPANVSKTFDKIDGRPVTNAFTQLKRPIV